MKKTLKKNFWQRVKGKAVAFAFGHGDATFGHEKLIQKVEATDEELKVMVSSM